MTNRTTRYAQMEHPGIQECNDEVVQRLHKYMMYRIIYVNRLNLISNWSVLIKIKANLQSIVESVYINRHTNYFVCWFILCVI